MPVRKVKKSTEVKEVVKGVPDTAEVVKASAPLKVDEPKRRVGLSKGMTINMGDYQSARVDLWMERVVPDNDRDVEKAIMEMSESIDGYLAEEIEDLRNSK